MSNDIPPVGAKPLPPLPREDLEHILAHTRDLWEEVRGQNIFITGGTGFFGMWLLESFVQANEILGLRARATVLTRNVQRFVLKAPHLAQRTEIEYLEGDVRSFEFPSGYFPYFIHAATESSAELNQAAPHEMFSSIVDGTRRVLEFGARAGIKKLLYTSSGAVYGPQPPNLPRIPEDYLGAPDPLLSQSAYGEGKRVAEHLCSVHATRFNYSITVARCFAFIGPHLPLNTHFAAGNFIRDALRSGPIQVLGDEKTIRSYLYASDLAIWLWTLLFRGAHNRAYNVGSSESITIGELARVVAAVAGQQTVQVATGPVVQHRTSYVPATDRIRSEINLPVPLPLAAAIRKTITWYSSEDRCIAS